IRKVTSPRRATEKELKRFLTEDRFHKLEIDRLGDCEVIEAVVRENAYAAGKTLRENQIPGMVIFAVIRGAEVKVPAGNDELMPGDNIYANVEKSARKEFLRKITGK
ncbi:MAG: TrkA C-terminal domain-containing protein, partial [Verrucomicrobiota bacterium]